MKIKCRGYEGKLIRLDAAECVAQECTAGNEFYVVAWYYIEIRTTDRAKICMDGVSEDEIELITVKNSVKEVYE